MLLKGKKVLVIGGTCFIESNLSFRLVQEGADVTVLDSMFPNCGGNLLNSEIIKDKIHINFSDMRDHNS